MSKAFGGLRIIDITHVLAGPYATYQLAVLGAEVIKIESPNNPDQARMQGADRDLNDALMGTAYLAQASNKKALALNLKTASGREALKRLVLTADVFVQNFRPGAFESLGLGYAELTALQPKLIYCSISAFGATGPRREETGYDNVLQAFTGIMAMTGHGDGRPLKSGAQMVDYATGLTAAFAISAALFQRERMGGKGQHIDVSMLDVALTLCTSHIAGFTWNGSHPEAKGNRFPFATIGSYKASDADLMIAASNLKQQTALWDALGKPEMAKTNNNQRLDAQAEEREIIQSIIETRTAAEWEVIFKSRRIPSSRIRRLEEAVSDPQVVARGTIHEFGEEAGSLKGLGVPVAGFRMENSPPEITAPPQSVGAQTVELLKDLGFSQSEIEAMRAEGAIN